MRSADTGNPLISLEEVATFLGWPKFLRPLIWLLFALLGWHRLNRVYAKFRGRTGIDFIHALVASRRVKLRYFSSDVGRIPRQGPAILVANHPLGAMDGLLLLQWVHAVRPDVKIMGNALLQRIEPLSPFLVGVNPYSNHHRRPFASGKGLLLAKRHVQEGGILIVFAGGEVSHFDWRKMRLSEPVWSRAILRLLKECGAPIHPVDIHASLSPLFYILGSLGPAVRTALLPGEAVRKRLYFSVDLRMGKGQILSPNIDDTELYATLETRRRQLRKLPPKDKKPRFFIQRPRKRMPIEPPVSSSKMAQEIQALEEAGLVLTTHGAYAVVLAQAQAIPTTLLEIGRLREITFRAIGEGSGKSRDLDQFDETYHHLLLWDRSQSCLVGAYRLGFGPSLFAQGGIRAFYLREFFKIKGKGQEFMAQSLEMGRAFVVPEAQQKPYPLFLLWKGIVHVLVRHPELRYVIGSVSISNSFSKHSQAVMLAFIKHHFWDKKWSGDFKPKKDFRVRLRGEDKRFVAASKPEDIVHIDRMIADLEPGNSRLPVLIKKYIGQNAKVLGFNRDPEFNTVDALMYMDIKDLPEKTLAPVLEELTASLSLPGVEGVDQPKAEAR